MILGVYGAGGLGREVTDIANYINQIKNKWIEICYVDDFYIENNNSVKLNNRVLRFDEFKNIKEDKELIIAIGEPGTRKKIYEIIKNNNMKLANLIHPNTMISCDSKIGKGVIISEFCSIHNNVEIADNVLIQPFCCIGHDIKINKNSVVSTMANIGGSSIIGEEVYLGMNCAILQKITIENKSIVSMGAVVYRNVKQGTTVIGNPARVTKGNEDNKVF
jgi:sugar O-acyltransferase (sialic acid O-acetyltransferase NeuD family)